MSADQLKTLVPGKQYRVLVRGQRCRVRRAFKNTYNRFGDIPCAVFTTRITGNVETWMDGEAFCARGPWRRLPSGEYDVPCYDLLECEPL